MDRYGIDMTLTTDLTWNPHAYVNSHRRGALVGTLLGVPVDGRSFGRGTAYQLVTSLGEVRTVWWTGAMYFDAADFVDVDTFESVRRNHDAIVSFDLLANL